MIDGVVKNVCVIMEDISPVMTGSIQVRKFSTSKGKMKKIAVVPVTSK
jgi:hypothetical protein